MKLLQNPLVRIVLLLTVVFAVAMTAFWITKRKTIPPKLPPSSTFEGSAPRDVAFPPITPASARVGDVTFSVVLPQRDLPSSVDRYTAIPSNILPIARRVAASLGFEGEPQLLQGASTNYLWLNEAATFTAEGSPPTLSLAQDVPPGQAPAQETAEVVIREFLTRHNLLPGEAVSLSVPLVVWLTQQESNIVPVAGPQTATVVGITFTYVVGGLPLFQQAGTDLGVSAVVGSGGMINSLAVAVPPAVQKTGVVQLLSIDEAIKKLKAGEGSFVGIDKTTGSFEPVIDVSFSAATITEVSLGFVFVPDGQMLSPVYVFSGKVTEGSVDARGADIVYFVPAAKN